MENFQLKFIFGAEESVRLREYVYKKHRLKITIPASIRMVSDAAILGHETP